MNQLCILLLGHDYSPSLLYTYDGNYPSEHSRKAMEITIKIFQTKLHEEHNRLTKGLPTTEMVDLKRHIHNEITTKIDLKD